MTIRFDRPVSLVARLSRRLAQFAFLLILVVLAAHRFGLLATPYFVALVLLSAAIVAVAVPLAVIGLVRLWQVGAKGGRAAVRAILYAALPLALVSVALVDYVRYPSLYDISTDLADAPPWLVPPAADQLWLPRRAAVVAQDRERQYVAYPGLSGRRYEGAMDRVYQAVKKVMDQSRIVAVKVRGIENTRTDLEDYPAKPAVDDGAAADSLDNVPVPQPRPDMRLGDIPAVIHSGDVLIQGEVKTFVLGLRFDTMIRLREEAETTFVDMRIAARYGPHDLGFGADIVDRYLRALDAELLGIARK